MSKKKFNQLVDWVHIIQKANEIMHKLEFQKLKLDEVEIFLFDEGYDVCYTSNILRIVSREIKRGLK